MSVSIRAPVADLDLQLEVGGHPDPEIRGAAGFKKISFRPLGPHFGLEITVGGGGGPGRVSS